MKPVNMNEMKTLAGKVFGFEVEEFQEGYDFMQDEIMDGVIITEEDLQGMNDIVLGLTSYVDSKEICNELGIEEQSLIQIGVIDADNNKAIFAFADETMSTLYKKEVTEIN